MGELLVDFGAVVVVVGADVVVLLELDFPVLGFAVLVGVDEVALDDAVLPVVPDVEPVLAEETALAAAEPPGISDATMPPRTAALSAAPPAAIPVNFRTLRRAADLSFVLARLDMTSSSAAVRFVLPRMNHIARAWQAKLPPLCACCELVR